MAIKIPVFVSAPSSLSEKQQAVYDFVLASLDEERLQPRALGRGDFPQSDPVTEVYYIARACYGGMILGFAQVRAADVVLKPDTPSEKRLANMQFPTPWNQIEAGILVALRTPLMVFSETGVEGGVFDQGAVSGYLQRFDPSAMSMHDWEQLRERVRLWSAAVRTNFRS